MAGVVEGLDERPPWMNGGSSGFCGVFEHMWSIQVCVQIVWSTEMVILVNAGSAELSSRPTSKRHLVPYMVQRTCMQVTLPQAAWHERIHNIRMSSLYIPLLPPQVFGLGAGASGGSSGRCISRGGRLKSS